MSSRGGRSFRSLPYASVDVPGRPNELGGLKECSEFIFLIGTGLRRPIERAAQR
jgi:hypothetical protein